MRRYERDHPGEMIHIDIKKLGRFNKVGHRITGDRTGQSNNRGVGRKFAHVCIDDDSRLGIAVERVMTDNGSFNKACAALGVRHIFTKPYTPTINGKAERFIQSSLREGAYARAYETSRQRAIELPNWLHHYNCLRPHAGIKGYPPISGSGLDVNNVMRLPSRRMLKVVTPLPKTDGGSMLQRNNALQECNS